MDITFGEDFLIYIELEIKDKYNIDKPKFLFNFNSFNNRRSLIDWFDNILYENRFVKYKHVKNNIFELKDFAPNQLDKICNKLVTEYLKNVKQYTSKKYGKYDVFFNIGYGIYSEQEIRKELLFHLKNGVASGIWEENDLVPDLNNNNNRIILYLTFHEEEIDIDLDSGFLILENKY